MEINKDFGPAPEQLIKNKQRIADHGEVFTPSHIVEAMLDLVKDESERIDSRILEPACGEGNFLKQVLVRKLATVQTKYATNEFERRHYALLALMSIYGIELLEDNAQLCRANLESIFNDFINEDENLKWGKAAKKVLQVNIVNANALTMKTPNGDPLSFPEWGYIGVGKFQRRDFKYDNLAKRSSFVGTLFDVTANHDIFSPARDYGPLSVQDIAEGS